MKTRAPLGILAILVLSGCGTHLTPTAGRPSPSSGPSPTVAASPETSASVAPSLSASPTAARESHSATPTPRAKSQSPTCDPAVCGGYAPNVAPAQPAPAINQGAPSMNCGAHTITLKASANTSPGATFGGNVTWSTTWTNGHSGTGYFAAGDTWSDTLNRPAENIPYMPGGPVPSCGSVSLTVSAALGQTGTCQIFVDGVLRSSQSVTQTDSYNWSTNATCSATLAS